jgi:hypothetical protein
MGADQVLSDKFKKLSSDFEVLRELAGDRFFSFYNKIEAQVLLGERTPEQMFSGAKLDKLPEQERFKWRLLQTQI